MSANVNAYLNLRGTARDALTFYGSVFGAEPRIGTFDDFGMPVGDGEGGLVMHGQLDRDGRPWLMASDVPGHMAWKPGENTFSVSLSGDDEAVLTGWWNALSEGATVTQPLEKAPWGDSFGMLTDRFGVSWLVNISGS
ncbi:VOC family protein [Amnibacterium kyonggiense]|uniref:PhnB protein n=1 Tax=Amnibacterium kyonggiense TaxID=595671 RepID=A0A4R7FKR1_9MICO|nr:VOC family protein [Amnibacterium kyonggiense]TDS76952.1 PhnB protein [Amnibacterium kyonggiense]